MDITMYLFYIESVDLILLSQQNLSTYCIKKNKLNYVFSAGKYQSSIFRSFKKKKNKVLEIIENLTVLLVF